MPPKKDETDESKVGPRCKDCGIGPFKSQQGLESHRNGCSYNATSIFEDSPSRTAQMEELRAAVAALDAETPHDDRKTDESDKESVSVGTRQQGSRRESSEDESEGSDDSESGIENKYEYGDFMTDDGASKGSSAYSASSDTEGASSDSEEDLDEESSISTDDDGSDLANEEDLAGSGGTDMKMSRPVRKCTLKKKPRAMYSNLNNSDMLDDFTPESEERDTDENYDDSESELESGSDASSGEGESEGEGEADTEQGKAVADSTQMKQTTIHECEPFAVTLKGSQA